MGELHVWSNGTDTYVAESAKDCEKIYFEHYGDPYPEDGDAWLQADDGTVLPITIEDEPNPCWPPHEFEELKHGARRYKLTCADWVKWSGRGFIGSTEF